MSGKEPSTTTAQMRERADASQYQGQRLASMLRFASIEIDRLRRLEEASMSVLDEFSDGRRSSNVKIRQAAHEIKCLIIERSVFGARKEQNS